jgi:predicted Zn-ribbon and HTH transcriptional regulator
MLISEVGIALRSSKRIAMTGRRNTEGTPAKCKRCGYEWLSQSELYYVSCPRCKTLVKIREPPPAPKKLKKSR